MVYLVREKVIEFVKKITFIEDAKGFFKINILGLDIDGAIWDSYGYFCQYVYFYFDKGGCLNMG